MTRMTFCPVVLWILTLVPNVLSAAQKPLPPDLALVPPDCSGFVHVRLQDVWKSEHAKEWRDLVMKAGAEAIKAFDDRFFPTPSTVERVTFFFYVGDRFSGGQDEAAFLIACSKPIDKAAFMKHNVPMAKEETVNERTYLFDKAKSLAICFVDDKTLAVGDRRSVRRLLTQPKVARGPLTDALHQANRGKPIVIGISRDIVPAQVLASWCRPSWSRWPNST